MPMALGHSMIEAGTSRPGRWLREHRVRAALWIAVLEGIVVALEDSVSRWTVLVVAAVVLAFYVLAGRDLRWDVGRQLSWIAAASQVLAVLVVVFAFIVGLLALVLVGILAVVALLFLFRDHARAT